MTSEDKKIKRYESSEYLFLISEWQRTKPSDKNLSDLIRANKLNEKYGVKFKDVIRDINEFEIERIIGKERIGKFPLYHYRLKNDVVTIKPNNIQDNHKNIEDRKKINISYLRYKDYRYMGLIEKWSESESFSDKKLSELISANKLDKLFGVSLNDVRIDIANYDYIIDQLVSQHKGDNLSPKKMSSANRATSYKSKTADRTKSRRSNVVINSASFNEKQHVYSQQKIDDSVQK